MHYQTIRPQDAANLFEQPPLPEETPSRPERGSQASFARVREAAMTDPVLGGLWDQLFDDGNP